MSKNAVFAGLSQGGARSAFGDFFEGRAQQEKAALKIYSIIRRVRPKKSLFGRPENFSWPPRAMAAANKGADEQ